MSKLNINPILPCRIYWSGGKNIIYIDFIRYTRYTEGTLILSPFNFEINPPLNGYFEFRRIENNFSLSFTFRRYIWHLSKLDIENVHKSKSTITIFCDFKYVPRILRSLFLIEGVQCVNFKTFIPSYKEIIDKVVKLSLEHETINTTMVNKS